MAIPVTVIGGYLGAGKTTLLNHLLTQSRGRRFAVLVNDFGDLNIDASLIQGEVLELANGCICCTLRDGLSSALHQVSQMVPPPEHVLVEASGISNPTRVAALAYLAPFVADGIVVVADAESLRSQLADRYVGDSVQRQLQSADLIILNKTDLVSPERLAEVRAGLPKTVIQARHGQVPLELLLGLTHARPEEPEAEPNHGYCSFSWQSQAPLEEAQLEGWPDSVLRAKGILHLGRDPGRRYIFQRMGARWTLTPDRPWGEERPCSQLVVIGLQARLEPEEILNRLGRDD